MKLKIEGMTCGHCVSSVKEALDQVAGVTGCEVDLDAREATVQGDVDVDVLVAAVRKKGFDASVS
jgi:copper chaperone